MELNEKQEKFCQAYVLRHNAAEAARIAGYAEKYAHTQGYKFLKGDTPLSEKINERIQELEGTLETSVNVVDEIESQYAFAKKEGHTNSAIKALELLSRIRGATSEKEIDLTPEKLDESIVNSLKILGKEKVNELIKKCGF
jgi:phage terminase small subunit|tara:strand:+ start:163 stop:585 length:423 start_codon:yes stop_codon:yes gene_type:complete